MNEDGYYEVTFRGKRYRIDWPAWEPLPTQGDFTVSLILLGEATA